MRCKCRADGELSRGRKGALIQADGNLCEHRLIRLVDVRQRFVSVTLAVWRSHPTVAIVRERPLGTEEILSGGVFFMQRNRQYNRETITHIAILSLLIALSIVAGKYLAIRVGDLFRFSLENTPILLAGILFGPLSGVLVGVIADLIGCVLVGYAINPLVTLGGAMIGLCAGLVYPRIKMQKSLRLSLTVLIAHVLGSVVVKSIGLSAYYDMPLGILMLWRTLNYLVVGILDGVILHLLMNLSGIAKYVKPDAVSTAGHEEHAPEVIKK